MPNSNPGRWMLSYALAQTAKRSAPSVNHARRRPNRPSGPGRSDPAEVMHAWREGPVLTPEGLCQATRDAVLFEHQSATPAFGHAAAAPKPPMPEPMTMASQMDPHF